VAAVFALPHNVVLNAKQQAAYNKLKRDNESTLRTAVAQAQSKNKEESAKGLTKSKEVRTKVHAGIKDILAMPAKDAEAAALKAQQQAAYEASLRRSQSGGACPCGRR